ncbi:MAG: protein kinase, partial [Myxococcales bacterium]|nr:protein kinase [Myxococcales bacterium]
FGIAKALGRSTKTATGVVKGKFAYMAPEQLRFEPVDRRTDLFALGILLFEMLAGRRLYKDDDESSGVQRILREPPPDIGEERPEVPPTLVALLFSLLAKSPDQRPSTAAEVAQRLEATLAELLADEPAIEVGDVLEELAGPTRERWEAELRQTLAKADEVPEIPASNTPPRSRLPRVAAFAGLVAVGFVAAFALAPDDVPAPVPSAAPPSVAPVATVQQPVEDDAPTVPPSVDEPAPTTRASSSNEASDDPHPPTMEPAAPTTEPEGVTTTSERTRPRRRRPRRAATATTTTTMWEEWE